MGGVMMELRDQISRRIDVAAEAAIGRDAEWGKDDCVLWCAGILAEPLGYDPVADFRGRYTTAIGYRRLLSRNGFENLADAIAAVARDRGWQPVKPEHARTGDIGVLVWKQHRHRPGRGNHLIQTRHVQTCTLRRGELWIVREHRGVANVRNSFVHHAWSITE